MIYISFFFSYFVELLDFPAFVMLISLAAFSSSFHEPFPIVTCIFCKPYFNYMNAIPEPLFLFFVHIVFGCHTCGGNLHTIIFRIRQSNNSSLALSIDTTQVFITFIEFLLFSRISNIIFLLLRFFFFFASFHPDLLNCNSCTPRYFVTVFCS